MNISDFSNLKKKHLIHALKMMFWFSVGALLALFMIINFTFLIFKTIYSNKVYPGVIINGVNFGGKSETQVKDYFDKRNNSIQDTLFTLKSDYGLATISAKAINFGYDSKLLSYQAFSVGRSSNSLSNLSLIAQ
ncbi:hypothetical protein M1349_02195, partial [Patescibacteria group bacterium]|nr:hypothetical protein [Patescibacteria group bacterium]